MLRKIRVGLAFLSFVLVTLLFLDFTGTFHAWFGWLAKIQFIPALLAFTVVIFLSLIIVTFLFGRIYSSIICPSGLFQDVVA